MDNKTCEQRGSAPDWSAMAQSPEFQALLSRKRRFVIPCCVFFTLYYFALLYLVGWHAKWLSQPILGKVNGAYLFALSQFVMAWFMAWLYMRQASKFDREAQDVLRLFGQTDEQQAHKLVNS